MIHAGLVVLTVSFIPMDVASISVRDMITHPSTSTSAGILRLVESLLSFIVHTGNRLLHFDSVDFRILGCGFL